MKNPNGYGSVIKLSGNRRKPWAARKTVGFNEKCYPKYKYIGYYSTRKEAMQGLAEYNKNPYDLDSSAMTVKDVYQMYHDSVLSRKSATTQKTYVSIYSAHLSKIEHHKFKDLQAITIQKIINEVTSRAMQKLVKAVFRNLEEYALSIGATIRLISPMLAIGHTEIQRKRVPFTEEEINILWENKQIPIVREALILLYSGWRISEYIDLKISDINNGCFLGGKKTDAGRNRIVPIHSRIQPLVDEQIKNAKSDHLSNYKEPTFRKHWNECPLLSNHIIHETRHTFRSRLDEADGNKVSIDLMMGHASGSVGERVYTHKSVEQLKECIELLR